MNQFLDFLSYEPDTGLFRWKKSPSSRALVGAVAGVLNSNGYRQIRLRGHRVYAHRLAWFFAHGTEPVYEIDHINGSPDDNRIANLRDIPRRVNVQNLRRGKSWHALGAQPSKPGKWTARIVVDGKVVRLGVYASEIAAHEAYVRAKRVLHEGCTL